MPRRRTFETLEMLRPRVCDCNPLGVHCRSVTVCLERQTQLKQPTTLTQKCLDIQGLLQQLRKKVNILHGLGPAKMPSGGKRQGEIQMPNARKRLLTSIIAAVGLIGCGDNGQSPDAAQGTFRNPQGSPERQGGTLAFARFVVSRFFDRRPPKPPAGHVLPKAAVHEGLARHRQHDSVTWIGHSTTLLHLNERWVVTDPFFGTHASPLPPLGPKRFVAPALEPHELPPVDVMVVSHNHYDHLDDATVRNWPGKERVVVVVPLRLGRFFRERGYRNVRELNWWESTRIGSLTITATPAIHFSRRGLFDYNHTLWASFVLTTERHNVFFAGDTAYGPVFHDIGERYGPFDLALLPIGAYEPLAFMRANHLTPEEAATAARDIRADAAIGIHWGTIILTPEAPFEPPLRFLLAMASGGFHDPGNSIVAIGETRPLSRRAGIKSGE